MKNNDRKEIFGDSKITNEIKKLMETEQICCDDDDMFDEVLLYKIIQLCESSGKIQPKNTIEILEELLLNSEFIPNTYFMDRYARCLTCACSNINNDDSIDEDYIKNAVNKLKLIIDNIEEIDLAVIINKFIECSGLLLNEQEPLDAEQTIRELKNFCDEVDAWEDSDNISAYKSALFDLHEIQCQAGDIDGAISTLNDIIHVVNTYDAL